MLSNTQVIAAVALLLDDEEETEDNVRQRTVWVRPWMARRETDGAFYTIFRELKEEDAEGFRGYVRLDTNSFDKLVNLLTPTLLKNDTVMRKCIKPEEIHISIIHFHWLKKYMLQKIMLQMWGHVFF